ncbi:DJ-1 family glyoxalase III [Marinimicrobium sp. ABcell2]|uniref:DJ-1 family glyoxalase III n=1 Tax=Marinimicrobium sp. ABcell2 TaxID=3069751 RepID=UPI0027B642A4|nr:DJ-1 family glyoxalase III [Marinimicrobium sp. ABcell2]MDQ2076868.1 DJ-1/PfpI family protein [Marinimicrobium sp. ABcell2]
MTATALVPIANGSEDIETVTIIDILRRAGVDTLVASVHDQPEITAARDTRITADGVLEECLDQDYDLIALPGGPGAKHLRDCAPLIDALKQQRDRGGWYAAICAAPAVVLAHHGLLDGLKATAFPDVQEDLPDRSRADERVVTDGHCITSQGPGTALEFSLMLVEKLCGKVKRDEIESRLVMP